MDIPEQQELVDVPRERLGACGAVVEDEGFGATGKDAHAEVGHLSSQAVQGLSVG